VDRRGFLRLTAAAALACGTPALPVTQTLEIPIYRQQHALTCEAAALRMALGAQGVDVSESAILERLARDRTPRRVRTDGTVVWGDPDLGFVGAFDGVFARDGYGVYDGPIADVAKSFGLAGTAHAQGADPLDLYAAVRQGSPVLVWVPYGLTVKGRGQWVTPDGKEIPYVLTEHCVVLAGVTDSGVLYADPLQPTLVPATFEAFEAAFAEIDNRAVIVSA
jgi:uncharacterized protein YvpB